MRTRSSNNSASALNLLTNPDKPIDPFLPSTTRGLNLDSSAASRNTMRGYAIGIPGTGKRLGWGHSEANICTCLDDNVFYTRWKIF